MPKPTFKEIVDPQQTVCDNFHEWIQKQSENYDPLKIFRNNAEQKVSPEEFAKVDLDIKEEIDAAVEFSMTSPAPSLDTLISDVYSTY